jgi:DNA primase
MDLGTCLDIAGCKKWRKLEESYSLSCPFAHKTHAGGTDNHPSGYIVDGKYFCFSCKKYAPLWLFFDEIYRDTGNPKLVDIVLYYLDKHEKSVDVDAIFTKKSTKEMLPYSPLFLKLFQTGECDEVRNYLASRGISLDLISLYQLKYDPERRRVVFPILIQGELFGAQGRSTDPKAELKYLNYWHFRKSEVLGGLDNLSSPVTMVLLVEGYMGLLKAKTLLPEVNVLCSFGSLISEHQARYLSRMNARILVCLDSDDAGRKGQSKFISKYSNTLDLISISLPQDIDTISKENLHSIIGKYYV